MNNVCVYRHTAPDGRMYIGIAQDPKIRWANGKGYKENKEFWKCICEVGWDNIEHEILFRDLESWDARKIESKLIDLYGTLQPNGFNRCRDNPEINRVKHKKEVGRVYGQSTVIDYWPDKEGMKVYKMRCSCGSFFVCKWEEITKNLCCDECRVSATETEGVQS